MNFITLTQSGTIIDLDSVVFVTPRQGGTVPTNGIRIGLAGHEQLLFGDDARQFLADLRNSKQVNVEKLMKWIPEQAT
jgi:hypothetical protein